MSKQIKKIAVFGIGGVGGYFGGRIAHKINKDNLAKEIYFIGRGEHLQTIQKQGGRIAHKINQDNLAKKFILLGEENIYRLFKNKA
jgi:ketopantoate reductase